MHENNSESLDSNKRKYIVENMMHLYLLMVQDGTDCKNTQNQDNIYI